ncbi:hypothetical protein SAMN02745196_00028 [Clostridium collagenovorans DSM 3089]|uniref:Uncharacterized protein n=1 Tax=Clostridium collagenovorans DSM 3089 TaxID=1121306 RepID=A0A1M5S3P3_9CLOT|nr:hypothetical protein SAMN02745196_00028 [Clostridium collagenovorans DSM 3089]
MEKSILMALKKERIEFNESTLLNILVQINNMNLIFYKFYKDKNLLW